MDQSDEEAHPAMPPILTSLPGEIRGYVGPCGRQIHYREIGEGRPLILIHQALWSSIHFHRIMPLMAEQGFRVIAPDMPGHGMSSPLDGEPSTAAYAEAVARLMDALGLEEVAAAGHHGGALTAGRLAASFPGRVNRLAFDTVPIFTAEERAALMARDRFPQEIRADGSHFVDKWQGTRLRGDPDWSDATVHIAVTTFFLNGPWREESFDAAFTYDFTADVRRIACPTLAVFGRKDPLYPHRERLAALRPDFTYDAFPGAAAMILEHPEAWVARMGPFLKG